MSSEGHIPTQPRYDVQKAYPVPFRAATWSEDVNGNFVIVLKEHSIRKRGQPRPEAPGTNFVRIPLGPVATSNDPEKYSCVIRYNIEQGCFTVMTQFCFIKVILLQFTYAYGGKYIVF